LLLVVFEPLEKTTILPVEFLPLNHLCFSNSFLCVNCRGNLFLKIEVFLEAPEVTPKRFNIKSFDELKYFDSNFIIFNYYANLIELVTLLFY